VKKGILLHKADDDVGVTTMDLKSGEVVQALTLEGEFVTEMTLAEDVPLSHKVAMHDIEDQKHVIEYGVPIGHASQSIPVGSHVHTHNLKSLRWSGKSQIIDHN
jgi:(2R)-sulfolactate sulfo-lyase subunit alpha